MGQYTERELQNAIQDVFGGMSGRQAAKKWMVPQSTLQARLNGQTSRKEAFEPLQRLSSAQERHLVGWILMQDTAGNPPSHQQVRQLAQRVVAQNGDTKPLGKNWLDGFLLRNPEVKTLRGKRLDFQRANGASTDAIQKFFNILEIPAIKQIRQENRYNMDETGLAIGVRENGLVLGSSAKKVAMKKQSGQRFWSTIVECISATGRLLEPLVIFEGKNVQQQWFPSELQKYQNWHFQASSRGWTSNEIALNWLKNIFLPQTKPEGDERRLLVVNGHGSHCTTEFFEECYFNNILLLFLPCHSSHVLQPLDVAVFGPVKKFYRVELSKHPDDHDSSPIGKRIFLECYAVARKHGITKNNILAGWFGSGMWPVNRAKPLMSPLLLIEVPTVVPATPKKARKTTILDITTPSNRHQLKRLFDDFITPKSDAYDTRLVQRKIQKQLSNQAGTIAIQKARITQLEAQIDIQKHRKRAKVSLDPNTQFVQVVEVENVRCRLNEQLLGTGGQPIIDIDEFELPIGYNIEE